MNSRNQGLLGDKTRVTFSVHAVISGLAIFLAIVLACVSIVADPANAATGFTAQTFKAANYALPTSNDSFLDELDINVEDYTAEELAKMLVSDENKRRVALGRKYASEICVNEFGQTYGSEFAGDPITGEGVPDLIAVTADNGKDGYVYRDDYRSQAMIIDSMSLDEAQSISELKTIPVYESDGRTLIGEFALY